MLMPLPADDKNEGPWDPCDVKLFAQYFCIIESKVGCNLTCVLFF
jgi:hypothetical protein